MPETFVVKDSREGVSRATARWSILPALIEEHRRHQSAIGEPVPQAARQGRQKDVHVVAGGLPLIVSDDKEKAAIDWAAIDSRVDLDRSITVLDEETLRGRTTTRRSVPELVEPRPRGWLVQTGRSKSADWTRVPPPPRNVVQTPDKIVVYSAFPQHGEYIKQVWMLVTSHITVKFNYLVS